MKNYILNGHEPVEEPDILKWAKWYSTANRVVKGDIVSGVQISTVFLGINHAYNGGPPLLFETMIFGGENDGFQERYTTWEEAEEGHIKMVQLESGQ